MSKKKILLCENLTVKVISLITVTDKLHFEKLFTIFQQTKTALFSHTEHLKV